MAEQTENSSQEMKPKIGPSRWEISKAGHLRLLASIWNDGWYDFEDDTLEHYRNIIMHGVEEAAKHGRLSYSYTFEYLIEEKFAKELKEMLTEYLPLCLIRIVLQKEIEVGSKKWEHVGTYVSVDWSEDYCGDEEKWNETKEKTEEVTVKDD